MDRLVEQVDPSALPQHVAIIMDGNGRWAQRRGHSRIEGHRAAIAAVRAAVESAVELGIPYLTLYAFSTENWQRPVEEVSGLMQLLSHVIDQEEESLIRQDVRLRVIGDWQTLPESVRRRLDGLLRRTAAGSRLTLTLALSYGGRQDILQAVRAIAQQVNQGRLNPQDISDTVFRSFLWTRDLPDPELLIRTSGEQRISNFLLWESAYTEFVFLPILWPDFRREHFYQAIWEYQQRERRFGRVLS
ncbi:MAG: isoprenyl transferase [Bacteroidia bacterium]|nr:isoprenyl transferase [Bacteroidia bacterium]MCX7651664.1 isoprenyl transferase [Bacteroidia bacterium]MDW8417198.1 isoprenyl transferase [Bacteroidia bacterium]